MDTCFLFSKYLDDQGCFCLKLSEQGELIATGAQLSFSDIKILQQESRTIVVESGSNATLLDLELSWLPDRKARIAIPYALEDKLAQPVEDLHFAFDKSRFQNNHYLVTVMSKERMRFIVALLNKNTINFNLLTLDWFALGTDQACLIDSAVLVNSADFKGTLSSELALMYLKNYPELSVYSFQDSNAGLIELAHLKKELNAATWVAQNLLKCKPLNLCQGEMQHGNTSSWVMRGYRLSGMLALVWLISLIVVNGLSLHSLNNRTKSIDKEIAAIYHEFFPDAKQVISPKFRISQVVGNNSSDNQAQFWFLLGQFSKAVNNDQMTIEQLRYQNKILSVTLVTSDFATLEHIENKLKLSQLKVKQTQASTRDQKVVATLELS